jgi:hypothetical protein
MVACALTGNISGEATTPLGNILREAMRHSATRLLINQRIARGICRSRIEYRLLAAVEDFIWSMLTWPYFSDDLRVRAPYVDVCSRAS